jgi:hypothetical protein
MGVVHRIAGKCVVASAALVMWALGAGCQYQAVSAVELQIHQSLVDRQGLTSLQVERDLKISCAPPDLWEQLPEIKTLFYSHQQWRSPDHHAGMGVAYVHTLVPFSPHTILWFAKNQYVSGESARDGKGRLIAQWSDDLGRSWFEAENNLYHIKGYAMTHGCDAWVVYSGYRVRSKPPEGEIALAANGAESVAPITNDP